MTKRITFVIASLGAGGAERVMSIMANYWIAEGNDITILTLSDSSKSVFYELEPRINYVPLGLEGNSNNKIEGLLNNIKRIYKLRHAIKASKPDVIISFLDTTNILTTLATRGLKVPIILSEHNAINKVDIGWLWSMLRARIYPMADKVVLLSERMRSYYPVSVRETAVVIPNPVLVSQNSTKDTPEVFLEKPSIMAMGRLSYEKGFDLLMRSFAMIKDDYPLWSVTILGEGDARGELEFLRNELGLEGKVHMPGLVKNPYDYLRQADIFVLSSRNEGFPVALCEAMACGSAVISFDCMTGPAEIIDNGVNGILVPPENANSLANAMAKLIVSEDDRKRLGSMACDITTRFGVEKVMQEWIDLVALVGKQ